MTKRERTTYTVVFGPNGNPSIECRINGKYQCHYTLSAFFLPLNFRGYLPAEDRAEVRTKLEALGVSIEAELAKVFSPRIVALAKA